MFSHKILLRQHFLLPEKRDLALLLGGGRFAVERSEGGQRFPVVEIWGRSGGLRVAQRAAQWYYRLRGLGVESGRGF